MWHYFLQVQETIETAIRALPEDSDLDTKLTIKTEPMETTEKNNGDVKEPLHKRIKTDNDKNDEEDSEDEGDINTLDEMMCDIVDALQSWWVYSSHQNSVIYWLLFGARTRINETVTVIVSGIKHIP